ncbi:MAG: RHS repeat protein [Chloroflexi bacterium]|nr:RHS repeat protein [Chloroflexota bacterium]
MNRQFTTSRAVLSFAFVLIIASVPLVACGESAPPTSPPAPSPSSRAETVTSATTAPTTQPPSNPTTQPPTQGPQTVEVKYTYDGAGRLTQAEYSNGVALKYTYDKAGNLLRREGVRK